MFHAIRDVTMAFPSFVMNTKISEADMVWNSGEYNFSWIANRDHTADKEDESFVNCTYIES